MSTEFVNGLIRIASDEWIFFRRPVVTLDGRHMPGGRETDEPFTSRIGVYWEAVGRKGWDGRTDQPWSGAFISWCFQTAGAGKRFPSSARHSSYINALRLMSNAPGLTLHDPATVALAPGDLLWNARPDGAASKIPRTHAEALALLDRKVMFPSHVDIVVTVESGACQLIGGNVDNAVTRTTRHLDDTGRIADPRKSWIGVLKNHL